jgi:hypothetical protein
MFLVAAFLTFSACYGTAVAGDTAPDKAAVQECLLKALETAPGGMTVDELRAQCKAEQMTAAEKAAEKEEDKSIVAGRLYTDEENVMRPFTLMSHKPNYILLANYNSSPNNDPCSRIRWTSMAPIRCAHTGRYTTAIFQPHSGRPIILRKPGCSSGTTGPFGGSRTV